MSRNKPPLELLAVFLYLLIESRIILGSETDVIMVNEDSDACLPCSPSPKENLVLKLFDWKKDGQKEVFIYNAGIHYNNGFKGQDEQFKGRVSHFPEELENSNASIKIKNVKMEDSGNYTCIFPYFKPVQKFHLMLVVRQNWRDRSSEIAGASPKPYVTTLAQTKTTAKLKCEVHRASPKPRLQWFDGAGNMLPAEELLVNETGGRYDIILQTTVTKTDRYRCVATQEEISHQPEPSETFVFIRGNPSEVTGGVIGFFLGAAIAIIAVFVTRKCIRKHRHKAPKKIEVSF